MIRQNENILKRIEATRRFVPFTPSATSYGLEWNALQAARYCNGPASGEFSLPHVSWHILIVTIPPAERGYKRKPGTIVRIRS